MDLGISGKIALITAASSGLGKAVAAEFFREGVKVAICSRNQDKLEETAREIGIDDPKRMYYQTCDVTDRKQVKSMIDNLVKKWGSVDILISNAGG
ncbi:MAG: SDR family NAD(P)-dependent oxidoreductase, partial [Candidatus Cloacimonetes bacterium]|nr:SDR family NAD(P)-dependent oxidoreductase [Candidatus Cloacimonadota bacterium]